MPTERSYIGSLFDVAVDLWKSTPIQDNQQFIDLCWVIIEEVMGYHTFSEERLLIMTATFVNIASFSNKTSFELAEGVNFPSFLSQLLQLVNSSYGFVSKFFKNEEEITAFNFKAIQNDVDDGNEKQWDVEYSSNFAELVMHFIVVFKTISPMLPIQYTHSLKTFYSEFIRS
ncbi:hypothetical protein DAPPUDRAFT_322712 [Daphnia pulex]|uniref:Uncharacterized protein n=1 Tax=Daphnia pulex TaxID=6669 RepID=E9GWS7_DAPPU|nr:hypothetical protein DAPPUDRAFT_322712 [Daphnia pulex]|eukprot:EFX75955.1 hypothetical protein DAPPUDRAFT_322712 [Daphnia pulex]